MTSSPPAPPRTGTAALVYVTLSAAQRAAGLLVLPFITRALAPAEFGAIAFLVAVSGIASVVLGSAIETAVFRAGAVAGEENSALLRACQTWLYVVVPIVGVLGAALLLIGTWSAFGVTSDGYAVEFLAVCVNTSVIGFGLAYLRARERLGTFVLVASTTIVATVGARLALVVGMDLGVLGWALADLVAALAPFVICIVAARTAPAVVDRSTVRNLLRFTLPLIPHRAAFWSLSALDRISLSLVASLHQVGIYSLAANLSSASMMVLAEVNRALLIEYSRAGFPAPQGRLVIVMRVQLLTAVVVPAVIVSSVTLLRPVILGPRYDDALPVLAVLALGQIAFGVYMLPTSLLVQAAGQSGLTWAGSTLGAAVVLVGALVFGEQFGAHAIAWSTVAGYTSMMVVAFLLTRRHALDIVWRRASPGGLTGVCAVVAFVFAFIAAFGVNQPLTATIALVLALAATIRSVIIGRRDAGPPHAREREETVHDH